MIKAISAIDKAAKKSVLGVMLAAAVTTGASSPVKAHKQDKTPQSTEVVSKPAAEALKVNSVLQTTPTIPRVHNQQLDNMFLRFADDDKERKMLNDFMSELYKNTGTYYTTFRIQQEIDYNILINFLNKNFDIMKRFPHKQYEYNPADLAALNTASEKKDTILRWYKETYIPLLLQAMSFDHEPTNDEINERLDKLADKNLKMDNYIMYILFVQNYAGERLNGKTDVQSKSHYIAYSVNRLNLEMITEFMESQGVNTEACIIFNKLMNSVILDF